EQGAGPTWRARDVRREVDGIEEIARFRLGDVPFTLPVRQTMFGRLTREQRLQRRVEDVRVGLGFSEVKTASFVESDPDTGALRLPEPITSELGVLRTTLLPSVIDAVRRNVELGIESVALFEIARVYEPSGGELPIERLHLAAVGEGDFARAKGIVEVLASALKAELGYVPVKQPLFHPGRSARTGPGVLGELHPAELPGTWAALELDLGLLFDTEPGSWRRSNERSGPSCGPSFPTDLPIGVSNAWTFPFESREDPPGLSYDYEERTR